MKDKLITEQKSFWNKASIGWKKWNHFIMDWHEPIGKRIIELAEVGPSDIILDIGTGAGEPGMSASSIAVNGRVIGIDISEEMVRTANETAKHKSMKNYESILYDGYKIPFADETFDAAISRNGIMFSPDFSKSMSEVNRVLKPKGRVVISGWGPPENNESGHIVRSILSDLVNVTPVAVGEPGPYKFAVKGTLTDLLIDSQFEKVREVDVYGKINFDSFSHLWKFISESQMPVIEAIAKYGSECEEKIKTAVFDAVIPHKKNEGLEFKWHAVIGFGQKK